MTDIEKVRVLCSDRRSEFFTDEELEMFLEMEGGDARMAAADALDAMASDAAQVAKAQASGTFSVDTKSIPDALRKSAASLREQAANTPYSATFEPGAFPWYSVGD